MKLLKLILVVFLQLHNTEEPSLASPSIIIIGAGPAGIAAATRLLENGQKNILVLEAENRIGGRIYSVFFGDAYIDLGAEWCHGQKDNVVYDLVKEHDILQHPKIEKIVYHSKNNVDEDFGKELIDIMETIYVPDGHRDEKEGVTLGQYCLDKYNATIHERYHKMPDKLEVAKASLDLFHHYVLSSEGAFSWYEPSARSDYKDAVGFNYDWNGLGYKTVLEVLTKKFPDPSKQLSLTVLLNKEVVKIFWNESKNSVIVHCSDQTTFEADHVIFTPSIGVLKEKHERLFSPPLPNNKQRAIREIGFGAVMKIIMHFPTRWWPKSNFTEFNFIWNENDTDTVLKEFPEGPQKEGRSWLTELFTIMPLPYNPNVLIAWLTGDMIPQIELMANETLVGGLRYTLDKFLGHKYNITEPDSIIRTDWYTNPHFRGSYSYQTVEARRNNVTAEIELSKPLLNLEGRPIVLFAGEASHPYFYSTVHGAIETGFREADRIINSYK